MAKPPELKRILREDVKEAPDWIINILGPINRFMEATAVAFDKQLNFEDNMVSEEREISFKTLSTYSSASPLEDGFTTLQYTSNLPVKPTGIQLLNIVEENSPSIPLTSAVFLSWYQANGTVYINYITGLENSTNYKIRIRAT